MPPKKRPAKKTEGEPPAKRPSSATSSKHDIIWFTTSAKSPGVTEDLHGRTWNPKSYEGWTKEDWEEMRTLVALRNAPYAEDGYSIPMEWFKYDAEWRRHIREYQEDLGAGRYEPKWQEEAFDAMQRRARGEFDKFKLDQFEEFWGQKQKLGVYATAGESATIKLEELVKHKVIQDGDVFSYCRVFGKGKDRTMIEKDVKIMKIEGGILTFVIPLGRRKYAPAEPHVMETESNLMNYNEVADGSPTKFKMDDTSQAGQGDSMVDTDFPDLKMEDAPDVPKIQLDSSKATGNGAATHNVLREPSAEGLSPTAVKERTPEAISSAAEAEEVTDLDSPLTSLPSTMSTPYKNLSTATPSNTPSKGQATMTASQTPGKSVGNVTITSVRSLRALEQAIITADGRFENEGQETPRSTNPWRMMRGKRNNQDLGTLWEMREEYFVWQHPKIVKMPKPSAAATAPELTPTPAAGKQGRAERYAARNA